MKEDMNASAESYRKKMLHPVVYWLAMITQLPSAVFWRLKVKELNERTCQISLPFFWRTKNPFRSIYFAALAGAAELSTGVLCQLALAGRGKFSMLVVGFRAEFYKKANDTTLFSCDQGLELNEIIAKMEVNQAETFEMISTGTNASGEIIAKFFITWSFKRKS
jgi:hypothetical protein